MSLSSRAIRRSAQAAAAPVVGIILVLAGIVPAQASTAARWRIDKIITPAHGQDWLYSVVATGRTDAWAAGEADGVTSSDLLVEHYNGRGWRQVAIPADLATVLPGARIGIGATSPENVWVFELLVGHKQRILRWDGRRWHVSTAPSWVLRGPRGVSPQNQPGPATVAVQSRSSAWVFSPGATDQPSMVAHDVDGHWHLVQMPGVPEYVDTVSGNDIWASGTNASLKPIIMRWNGHHWWSHAAPYVAPITGDSSGSAWVLAYDDVEYWSGTAWTAIAVPPFIVLSQIVTDGHGGVWLWGLHGNVDYLATPTVFAHYGDGSWSVKNAPADDGNYAELDGLAQLPGSTTVIGVGWLNLSHLSGAVMRYGT